MPLLALIQVSNCFHSENEYMSIALKQFFSLAPVTIAVCTLSDHLNWLVRVESCLCFNLQPKPSPLPLIPLSDASFVADIVNQGRNVVICGVPNAAYCWRGIQHHWPNRPWPEQLRADLEATLTEVASRPPDRLFWYKAECTPDTSMVVRNLGGVPGLWAKSKGGLEKFEFLEDMAASANHAVYEVLQGVEHLPFNVLSTDFVQDDIVGLIVQLNDNAEEGRFTANESAEALDEVFAAEDTSMLVASTRGQHKLSSSHSSVSTARSNMNTSFDIRLQPAPPIELKETNM